MPRIETTSLMTQETPNSLRQLLEHRVEKAPAKIFLLSEADGRQFSYADFAAAVNRTASMLLAKGIRKGDAVSLLLPNSVEYIVAYFACWTIGAVAGPVNSLLKAQEIAYVISDSEAKALLVNSEFLPLIDSIRAELKTLLSVIHFDNEAEATREFVDSEETALSSICSLNSEDEAIIIYTSGTTGKPKGCV